MPFSIRPNPLALGDRIAQYSLRFDPATIRLEEVTALGVPIPASLQKAVAKRQMEWALGRYCARLACRQIDPTLTAQIGMLADRSPQWPTGLVGSITHTSGFVWSAVGRAGEWRGLGIDSEEILSEANVAELKQEIALAPEQERARAQAELDEKSYYSLLFSAKESLYKCLAPRVGHFFGYEDAEIFRIDWAGRGFLARLLIDLAPELPRGMQLSGLFSIEETLVHTAVLLAW